MPGDVHHVVHAAHQPEVPFVVPLGAITGEIGPREARPIRTFVPFRVAIDAAQHGWPRLADNQIASTSGHCLAVVIDDISVDSREWEGRGARFRDCESRKRRDHDHASLGLPPGVDDRTALLPDVLVVPDPCFRIDRFTYGAE